MKSPSSKLPTQSERAADQSGAPDAHVEGSPRLVIRGESIISNATICHQSLSGKISFIDYLSFTYRPEHVHLDPFPLKEVLMTVFNIPYRDWSIAQVGWNGYEVKANLGIYGLIAWGGISQRGTIHVQLYGKGCALVEDWIAVREWGISKGVKITRVDIAHDDFEGDIVNIENGREWAEKGLFSQNGRPPNVRYIDDCGSGKGKTLYIGERKNGKLIRIYEKGREQGDPNSPWCRAEVEYRSKSRKIEWDAILNPDHYISGSCEAFSFLSIEQSRLETTKLSKLITLHRAIEHCRTGYGQLINLLYQENGHDAESVVETLRRDGYPEKLKPYYLK